MSFERAPYPEHPNRCQATNAKGQCNNLGLVLEDGLYSEYCLAHGGNQAQAQQKKNSLRNYRLTVARWKTKIDEKAEATGIKSLRDEIAILRVCLEERLNGCHEAADLILQSGPISDMVMKIERVVGSCHKLEGSMGHLLDKQAILQFAQVVIGIISKNITDESQINIVADEILTAVGQIGGSDV
jgi:hypothetical protein